MRGVYDQILLPTDGSKGTAAAARHAGELAETYGATVHVLSVVDGQGQFGTATADMAANAWTDAERKRAQTAIDTTSEELPAATETESVLRGGDPKTEILTYAEESGTDMIVMGTHGRTGLDHYLIGSVAEKVVRRAPVPVLTVRLDEA